MTKIRDIRDLSVGDAVAIRGEHTGSDYVGMIQGIIVGMTPDKIRIQTGGLGLVELDKDKIDIDKMHVSKYIKGDIDVKFLTGKRMILESFSYKLNVAVDCI